MTSETRQQMIDRVLREHDAREAEAYKDKQMSDDPSQPQPRPTPARPGSGVIVARFLIGCVVRLKLDGEGQPGYVTAVTRRQSGIHYGVSWGDSRNETYHCDFELESDEPVST